MNISSFNIAVGGLLLVEIFLFEFFEYGVVDHVDSSSLFGRVRTSTFPRRLYTKGLKVLGILILDTLRIIYY